MKKSNLLSGYQTSRIFGIGGFTLLFIIGLSSCSLFQGPTQSEEPRQAKADTAKPGEKPKKEVIDTISVKKAVKDSLDKLYPYEYKDTYDIAFILPFYEDLKRSSDNRRKKRVSMIAQKFYWGARLALDTLKSCGINLDIRVYDSKNDSGKVVDIRNQLKKQKPDLIIGPLFSKNVKHISEFSARHKVNMVAPLANVRSCLANNPYYISLEPGKHVISRQAASLINDRFGDYNLFVVRRYDKTERQISWQLDSLADTNSLRSYNKLALDKDHWNTSKMFSDTLKKAKNVIFIPSKSEAFTTSIISGLKAADTIEGHSIEDEVIVIGLSDWLAFGSLNGKMMEKFQMHILSNYYIDYKNPLTRSFVKHYRNTAFTEPYKYAFKAFDITLLMGKMLVNYGKYFQRNWYDQKFKGLHNDFIFRQSKGKRGWQNFHLRTLLFNDYELSKAPY